MAGGLKGIVKTASAALPAPSGTVVLIYHRVGVDAGARGGEMTLPVGLFDEQMAAVAELGAGTLDDLSAAAANGARPADWPAVVVTFDDGTADILDLALPVLERHRVPALVYLATDFVESGRSFPEYGAPLSWSAVRDLVSSRLVTVGSHTHTHALLDRVPSAVAADELDRSIELIEDRVGATPRHFAYPKALLGSPTARVEVAARFITAAIAGTRPNRPSSFDPQRVLRSPIQHSDGIRYFEAKLAGRMRLEDDLRRGLNRLRYRGKTT